MRWPGLVTPGTEINEIFSAEDWVPTLVAAAGEPDIKSKLLQGYQAGGKTFKVHLDGYDQRDLLAGTGPDKRQEFFYWTDDGNLAGLRYDQWKAVFMEQRAEGFDVWAEPLVQLRLPELFNLRSDPLERAQHEVRRLCALVYRARIPFASGAEAGRTAPSGASANFHPASVLARSPSSRPWSCCARPAFEQLNGGHRHVLSPFSAGARCSGRWGCLGPFPCRSAAALPARKEQIRYHHGMTDRRSRPSSNSSRRRPTSRALNSCRRRSASPPSTRTARCGSSTQCTPR